MSKAKKKFFTYLFDRNFKGFRKGDLKKIDVINYSFGVIEDGKVSLKLLENHQEIIKTAHEADVKVVLAIGGWGADGFSDACLTKESRGEFIDSLIFAIKAYGFDGIDLDWEYPTTKAGGIVGREEDRENFTFLLSELRAAMDKLDEDLILSIAVPANPHAATKNYEIDKINGFIDYLHLMSYDLINYTELTSSHHANLLPSKNSFLSVAEATDAYIKAGLDPEKIIVGIAFFGHLFNVDANSTDGMREIASSRMAITYKNIVKDYLNNDDYKVFYDEEAKASWLYGKGVVISYDNPRSIKAKCDYVVENNLGGVMNWEYGQDDEDSTLVKAIYF